MRNEKRIEKVMELLTDIWKSNPDLRFFQLLYILQSKFSRENNYVGQVVTTQIGYDFFEIEDSKIEEFLLTVGKEGL